MIASVLTLVVAVVGFIVTVVLNAFVLDKYNAYGEVPIPGSNSLHLPAGEATVSFHTQTIGSPSGGGLPVPPLELTIVPPEGIPEPQVSESYGTTTTVNNDAHTRVWVLQIPAEGTYNVNTDGTSTVFARNVINDSEFTGACFSPDRRTLFVNIQDPGIQFAITGPWRS